MLYARLCSECSYFRPHFLVKWTTNIYNIIYTESLIKFQLETDGSLFTDLHSTRLFTRGRIIKGDQTRLDNAEETILVNNALHSFFINCEVYLNNEKVHCANSLYTHQAFVFAEFSGTNGTKESLSHCQGYGYQVEPNDFTERPFTDTVLQKDKVTFNFYCPLVGVALLPKLNFSQLSTSEWNWSDLLQRFIWSILLGWILRQKDKVAFIFYGPLVGVSLLLKLNFSQLSTSEWNWSDHLQRFIWSILLGWTLRL